MEEGHSGHHLSEYLCTLRFGEESLTLVFQYRLQDTALDVLENKVELSWGIDRVVQSHYVGVTLAELVQMRLVRTPVSIRQNTQEPYFSLDTFLNLRVGRELELVIDLDGHFHARLLVDSLFYLRIISLA